MRFFRGLLIALPISLLLWAVIIGSCRLAFGASASDSVRIVIRNIDPSPDVIVTEERDRRELLYIEDWEEYQRWLLTLPVEEREFWDGLIIWFEPGGYVNE